MVPPVKMARNGKRKATLKKRSSMVKKTKKDDIVVGASDLNWKTVEVPDTLGDFGGFYGLEEIDGVDVKVVDGKVQFIAHDESKVQSKEEESDAGDADSELVEFKNLDDFGEGELSGASSSDDDEEVSDKDEEESEKDDEEASDKDEDVEEDELQSQVFNADLDIEDVDVAEFPEWNKLGKLSVTTLQGLTKLGFSKPTDIQAKAIPEAMKGEDIMGKAATGSGKTLAYGIPILEKMLNNKDQSKAIALIFTPTRELAQQVTKHLQQIGELILKKSPYAIMSLTGGLSIQKQERLLKYDGSARVVVATPGRFLELIEKTKV